MAETDEVQNMDFVSPFITDCRSWKDNPNGIDSQVPLMLSIKMEVRTGSFTIAIGVVASII
jgi:hypothetical protein